MACMELNGEENCIKVSVHLAFPGAQMEANDGAWLDGHLSVAT